MRHVKKGELICSTVQKDSEYEAGHQNLASYMSGAALSFLGSSAEKNVVSSAVSV